jgi:hypothetical protein
MPPSEYEECTGKPVADNTAVWFRIVDDPSDNFNDWTLLTYADALQSERETPEKAIAAWNKRMEGK